MTAGLPKGVTCTHQGVIVPHPQTGYHPGRLVNGCIPRSYPTHPTHPEKPDGPVNRRQSDGVSNPISEADYESWRKWLGEGIDEPR